MPGQDPHGEPRQNQWLLAELDEELYGFVDPEDARAQLEEWLRNGRITRDEYQVLKEWNESEFS